MRKQSVPPADVAVARVAHILDVAYAAIGTLRPVIEACECVLEAVIVDTLGATARPGGRDRYGRIVTVADGRRVIAAVDRLAISAFLRWSWQPTPHDFVCQVLGVVHRSAPVGRCYRHVLGALSGTPEDAAWSDLPQIARTALDEALARGAP